MITLGQFQKLTDLGYDIFSLRFIWNIFITRRTGMISKNSVLWVKVGWLSFPRCIYNFSLYNNFKRLIVSRLHSIFTQLFITASKLKWMVYFQKPYFVYESNLSVLSKNHIFPWSFYQHITISKNRLFLGHSQFSCCFILTSLITQTMCAISKTHFNVWR